MLSVLNCLRLCSSSARRTSGRPRPGPPNPPLVATMQPSGNGERASAIVSSLCPPVYKWAVSIICTPAATAALTNATLSRVFVSRFVPKPIRATSMSPSFTDSPQPPPFHIDGDEVRDRENPTVLDRRQLHTPF